MNGCPIPSIPSKYSLLGARLAKLARAQKRIVEFHERENVFQKIWIANQKTEPIFFTQALCLVLLLGQNHSFTLDKNFCQTKNILSKQKDKAWVSCANWIISAFLLLARSRKGQSSEKRMSDSRKNPNFRGYTRISRVVGKGTKSKGLDATFLD